jgi:chorismate-pyruvate lyase
MIAGYGKSTANSTENQEVSEQQKTPQPLGRALKNSPITLESFLAFGFV